MNKNNLKPLLGILFVFLIIGIGVRLIPLHSYIPITPISELIASIVFILLGVWLVQDSIKDIRKDFKEKNASIYSQILNTRLIFGGVLVLLGGIICLYYLFKRHYSV
jgi:hypothetical protein